MRKISLLCEYAAALRDCYEIRTRQYRDRHTVPLGTVTHEGEMIRARLRLEEIEERLGLRE